MRRGQASLPSMFLQNFHVGFKPCNLMFNTNVTGMGKFLIHEVWRYSYLFTELLKSQLRTLLWRTCLCLLDPLPRGTRAADTTLYPASISPSPTASPHRRGAPAPASTGTSPDITLIYPGVSWAGDPEPEYLFPCRGSPCPGQGFAFAPVDFGVTLVGPFPQPGLFWWQPGPQGHPLITLAWCHLHTQWESTPSCPPGHWLLFFLCILNMVIQIHVYRSGKIVPAFRLSEFSSFIPRGS